MLGRRFDARRLASLTLLLVIALSHSTACSRSGSKRLFQPRKSSAENLQMALDSPQPDERRRGVVGLSESRDGRSDWAVKVFDTIARTDSDAMVRRAALRAMERAPNEQCVETCLKILTSPDQRNEGVVSAPASVRWSAAQLLHVAVQTGAFGESQREGIIDTLILRIDRERDQHTRLAMIETLGYFPERRVLDPLMGVLPEDNFTYRHAAEVSLARLTGVTHEYDPDAWKNWLASVEDPFASRGRIPEALMRKSKSKSAGLDWFNAAE